MWLTVYVLSALVVWQAWLLFRTLQVVGQLHGALERLVKLQEDFVEDSLQGVDVSGRQTMRGITKRLRELRARENPPPPA